MTKETDSLIDNKEVDDLALRAVRDGATRLSAIRAHIATRGGGYREREVDRALQRLRKRDMIRFSSSGWVSKEVITCPHCNGKGLVLGK